MLRAMATMLVVAAVVLTGCMGSIGKRAPISLQSVQSVTPTRTLSPTVIPTHTPLPTPLPPKPVPTSLIVYPTPPPRPTAVSLEGKDYRTAFEIMEPFDYPEEKTDALLEEIFALLPAATSMPTYCVFAMSWGLSHPEYYKPRCNGYWTYDRSYTYRYRALKEDVKSVDDLTGWFTKAEMLVNKGCFEPGDSYFLVVPRDRGVYEIFSYRLDFSDEYVLPNPQFESREGVWITAHFTFTEFYGDCLCALVFLKRGNEQVQHLETFRFQYRPPYDLFDGTLK